MPQSFSTFQKKLTPPSFEEGAGISIESWHAEGLCRLLLAHLSLFLFLREENIYLVCTYEGFDFPVLGPLSITSCIASFGAPSTRTALDLGVGMGGSPPRIMEY